MAPDTMNKNNTVPTAVSDALGNCKMSSRTQLLGQWASLAHTKA